MTRPGEVIALSARAAPLRRQAAEVAGAALADLVAIWIAGYQQPDDAALTKRIREKLLKTYVAMVRKLS